MQEQKSKFLIWGTGKYGELAYKSIDFNNVNLLGFLDMDNNKIGKTFLGYKVFSVNQLMDYEVDYIFLAAKDISSMQDFCRKLKFNESKVLHFNKEHIDNFIKLDFYKEYKLKQEEIYKCALSENEPYEKGQDYIEVLSGKNLLEKIIKEKCSLTRFGDGEFNVMIGDQGAWFQGGNTKLAKCLIETINKRDSRLLIAIANNFNDLSAYTPDGARDIRLYLSNRREKIVNLLDKQYGYYDAYVSRPYLIFKDKDYSTQIFSLWKEVWKNRDVLIVEGPYVRNGMNNDLFDGANSIRRIICPAKDSFDYYEEILTLIYSNVSRNDLVLISLGPTASVLAGDIFKKGFQALDIGQLDNEYEWYLKGAKARQAIEGKGVPELRHLHFLEDKGTEEYIRQVIAEI